MATLKALLIGGVKNYGSKNATDKLNLPFDITDAIAIALTHANNLRIN